MFQLLATPKIQTISADMAVTKLQSLAGNLRSKSVERQHTCVRSQSNCHRCLLYRMGELAHTLSKVDRKPSAKTMNELWSCLFELSEVL